MKKRELVIIIIALLAVISAVYGWYHPKTVEVPVYMKGDTEYREVTKYQTKTVRVPIYTRETVTVASVDYKTVEVPVYFATEKTNTVYVTAEDGSIPVYDDHAECGCFVIATEENLNGEPVTAKAEVPGNKAGYDISSTITPSTGESHIFTKPKKISLFGFENDKEIGARYGLKSEVDVFGRWTFVRVGSFYFSGYAEANTDKNANAMIEGSYRW